MESFDIIAQENDAFEHFNSGELGLFPLPSALSLTHSAI